MDKIIIIGQKGILSNVRDQDTQDAIDLYCKEKNITSDQFEKRRLSIYAIEFDEDNSSYIHIVNTNKK